MVFEPLQLWVRACDSSGDGGVGSRESSGGHHLSKLVSFLFCSSYVGKKRAGNWIPFSSGVIIGARENLISSF